MRLPKRNRCTVPWWGNIGGDDLASPAYCMGQDRGAVALATTNLQHPVPSLGALELDQRHPVPQLSRRSVAEIARYLFELLLDICPVTFLFLTLR